MMNIEEYLSKVSDGELKTELKRRSSARADARASVMRCKHCKHFGEVSNYYVGDKSKPTFASWYGNFCPFKISKNGKHYLTIPGSTSACKEHFEKK